MKSNTYLNVEAYWLVGLCSPLAWALALGARVMVKIMQNAMVDITQAAVNGSFGGFSDPPGEFCMSITVIVGAR